MAQGVVKSSSGEDRLRWSVVTALKIPGTRNHEVKRHCIQDSTIAIFLTKAFWRFDLATLLQRSIVNSFTRRDGYLTKMCSF